MEKSKIKQILEELLPNGTSTIEKKITVEGTYNTSAPTGNRLNSGTLRSQVFVCDKDKWEHGGAEAAEELYSDQRVFVQTGDDDWDVYIGDALPTEEKKVNKRPPKLLYSGKDLKKLVEDELKKIKSKKCSSLIGYDITSIPLPQIFYGAPGTGKTRHVQKIYDKFDEKARIFTTFHQSYSYEDFVEGLKPILEKSSEDVKYQIEKGVFYKACESAAKLAGYSNFKECIKDTKENRTNNFNIALNEGKIMLLCIDEINRGNVASIFGDLISLIEPSKRLGAGEYEMIVTLPYSKEKFGVPANLLIVGTMNTADRSIQLLDSALRRRFEFVEMMPELDTIKYGNAKSVLQTINNRIRCLLNKDNQIGHSYLVNANSDSDILKAIIYKIIPLLEEYFYNDIDKVRFVLNETDKVDYPFYIEDEDAANAYLLYSEGIDEPKSFFKLDETIKDILDDEEKSAKYIEHLL